MISESDISIEASSPVSDDRPSMFVALQEQLGLKLAPATEGVESLVIDQGVDAYRELRA